MTLFVGSAGSYNLALLSDAQRQAIEAHKQKCFARHQEVKTLAREIYSGLNIHGRMWAERKLIERKNIESAVRLELNLMMGRKK